MIKIYGMPSCPYCEYVHKQIKGREKEFQFIDIGKNIRTLRLCLKTAGCPLIRRMRG